MSDLTEEMKKEYEAKKAAMLLEEKKAKISKMLSLIESKKSEGDKLMEKQAKLLKEVKDLEEQLEKEDFSAIEENVYVGTYTVNNGINLGKYPFPYTIC